MDPRGEESSDGAGASIEPGMILISPPGFTDPNFMQTVVLIVDHDDDGSFGLILNRKTELDLAELAGSLKISWGGSTPAPKVFAGGPVMPGTLWLLHDNSRGIGVARRVHADLSLTAEAAAVRALLIEPAGRYRFFLGYSGWSSGQLEGEIAAGVWYVATANTNLVYAPQTENLWADILRENGIDVR